MMSVHFTLSDIDPEVRLQKEVTGNPRSKLLSTHFFSKKRKVEDLYDINNPASNLLIAADIIIEEYTDRVKTIDALTATLKKRTFELEKAKQKIKTLEAILAEGSNHTFLEEVKKDATIAVLESKIHMATEAAENGLDSSLWNIKGWEDKLEKMKDNFVMNPFFIGFGGSKAPKRYAHKAPSIKIIDVSGRGEASTSNFIEEVAPVDDSINSEGSSGEEGI